MTAEDIQKILENLGEKVSILAEENRVLQTRDDAGQQLISLLSNNINEEDWVKIYRSTDDVFRETSEGRIKWVRIGLNIKTDLILSTHKKRK